MPDPSCAASLRPACDPQDPRAIVVAPQLAASNTGKVCSAPGQEFQANGPRTAPLDQIISVMTQVTAPR